MPNTSLKAQNLPHLRLFVCVHATVAFYIALGTPTSGDALWTLATADWTKASGVLLAGLVVMFLNGLPSRKLKTRLVFLRWRNPEPACRAFTDARPDPRLRPDDLRCLAGDPLPTSANAQNAAWYKLYQAFESHPSVRTNHREYLLFRDLSWLSLAAGTVGVMTTVLASGGIERRHIIYASASFATLIACIIVAQRHGERFVYTVLSVAAAKSLHPGASDE